jgi:acetyl coenzyme A synthetase (ADP forming)-like protein
MTTQKDTYPSEYNVKVILKDGSTILFRPIKKDDAPEWLNFWHRLSSRSKYLRLHRSPPNMSMEDALRFCTVDYVNSFAFVAEAIEGHQKHIVAVGRYSRLPATPNTAEIAFIILDAYQEKGIGTKFIEWLATVARKNDIDTFEAYVLPENTEMMSVFQGYGFHMKQVTENNIYHISFHLTRTTAVVKAKDERASQATLHSLEHILKPHSVAVVGASNRPGTIGQLIFQSMIQSGFNGVVYPINATNDAVMSVKAYRSVLSVPGEIDLAIVAVPAAQVLGVVDECGQKKVKGLIVISDGFQEKGEEGAVLEREMVDMAFGYGMRIVGPNCMGLINTDPQVKLNATFALTNPAHGNISFISQSGALGLGILEYAKSMNIGFSTFVSVGNRADIASTDLLQYWEQDAATRVILLYLESFDNTDIFSRVSRRISRNKPILAIKGGSTPAGSRASRSHTGAIATSDVVSDALFREAGIVMVDSIGELFDSAILFANQPIPKGKKVAILTNGGGPGILAADACAHNGLLVPELSAESLSKIKSVIKRDIHVGNPVDLTAGVSAEEFEDVLKILAADPGNDAILTIYVPPAGLDISSVENAISRASPLVRQNGKPLLSCFVGMSGIKGKAMDGQFVPYYLFPEEAATALTNAVKYSELKTKETGVIPVFKDIERGKSRQLINEILTSSPQRPIWIDNRNLNELFKYYGIHFAETLAAATPEAAGELAAKTGFPVVLKLNSATITHKTDVGGVILDIKSPAEAIAAFNQIRSDLVKIGRETEMQGVTVQCQITDGLEVIVGVTQDRMLGHVVMFGLGGIYAELIKDTAIRLHPLTDIKAGELIDSVKMAQVLKGYRGMPPYDTKSLEDLLLRISALVEDNPQITEMDLNPVKVQPDGQGYWVVDARIMIQ